MYTYDEYRQHLDKCLQSDSISEVMYGFMAGSAVKKYYDDMGKTPMDYDVYDAFKILSYDRTTMSTSAVNSNKLALKRFLDYLAGVGIEVFDYTEGIDPRYIITKSGAIQPYYLPDEITFIINSQGVNKDYFYTLIGTFYYGIASMPSNLYDLRLEQLNADGLYVEVDGRQMHIPEGLRDAYLRMTEINHYYRVNPRANLGYSKMFFNSPSGALVPYIGSDRDALSSYCKFRFQNISSNAGVKVTHRPLYISGFLNYISDQIGFDECIELFESKERTKGESLNLIRKYCDEYGFTDWSKNVKQLLLPYVVSMKEKLKK